jgi:hypothetical protein
MMLLLLLPFFYPLRSVALRGVEWKNKKIKPTTTTHETEEQRQDAHTVLLLLTPTMIRSATTTMDA